MVDWADGEHPDEGSIHAWLDGALDADESAKMETHVDSCASCASRVAEARGLIAGASRVVHHLDDAPAPLLRPAGTPTVSATGSAWRMLRVTPARASIAAVLLVALGITFTYEKSGVDSSREMSALKHVETVVPTAATSAPMDERTSSVPAAAPMAPRQPLPMQDSVLRSAVARRIASEQPQRVVEAAADAAVPVAPPPSVLGASARAGVSAGSRVAAGRAELQVGEMTRKTMADNVSAAPASSAPAGGGCFRLESKGGAPSEWRGVPLPMEIVLSSAGGAPGDRGEPRFAIRTPREERAIGAWTRSAGDTLSLTMFGASATTSALLVPGGETREGLAYVITPPRGDAAAPAASSERRMTLRKDAGGLQIVARRIACAK